MNPKPSAEINLLMNHKLETLYHRIRTNTFQLYQMNKPKLRGKIFNGWWSRCSQYGVDNELHES